MRLKLDENLGKRIADIFRIIFKPTTYSGIVVLRLPRKPSPEDLLETVQTVITGLALSGVDGKLWIAQRGRIREYQEEGALDDM